jgi:hypothetical protein
MQHSKNWLESLLERWIREAKPDPAQTDIRKRRVALDVVGEDRTDDEPGGWAADETPSQLPPRLATYPARASRR